MSDRGKVLRKGQKVTASKFHKIDHTEQQWAAVLRIKSSPSVEIYTGEYAGNA